mgnify:FL=1|tara:strand:- start:6 stop:461 length:456 start_codon:yes stop_codon:yes gene_type:complete
MRSHHILKILNKDFEFEGVQVDIEWLKRLLMSLFNTDTYSIRKRARGKRKVHAIANGYHARAYDQELPLEHGEEIVYYFYTKPTKVDKRLQAIKKWDWKIKALKASIEEVAEGRIELKYKAENMKEYQRLHMEELQLAIRERAKLTTVEEV